MILRIVGRSTPKAGNTLEEYEDAWASSGDATRVALADGASDSFESGTWAKALVDHFVTVVPGASKDEVLAWTALPIKAWEATISWDSLPWYGREKANRGAFATLLTVAFRHADNNDMEIGNGALVYDAMALGDACLFVVRDGELIVRFPVTSSAEFGTTPPLFSTRGDYNTRVLTELRYMTDEFRLGDLMFLATDALAAWILRSVEARDQPWLCLQDLPSAEFEQLINGLREKRLIQNDDITLVMLSLDDDVVFANGGSSASEDAVLESTGS